MKLNALSLVISSLVICAGCNSGGTNIIQEKPQSYNKMANNQTVQNTSNLTNLKANNKISFKVVKTILTPNIDHILYSDGNTIYVSTPNQKLIIGYNVDELIKKEQGFTQKALFLGSFYEPESSPNDKLIMTISNNKVFGYVARITPEKDGLSNITIYKFNLNNLNIAPEYVHFTTTALNNQNIIQMLPIADDNIEIWTAGSLTNVKKRAGTLAVPNVISPQLGTNVNNINKIFNDNVHNNSFILYHADNNWFLRDARGKINSEQIVDLKIPDLPAAVEYKDAYINFYTKMQSQLSIVTKDKIYQFLINKHINNDILDAEKITLQSIINLSNVTSISDFDNYGNLIVNTAEGFVILASDNDPYYDIVTSLNGMVKNDKDYFGFSPLDVKTITNTIKLITTADPYKDYQVGFQDNRNATKYFMDDIFKTEMLKPSKTVDVSTLGVHLGLDGTPAGVDKEFHANDMENILKEKVLKQNGMEQLSSMRLIYSPDNGYFNVTNTESPVAVLKFLLGAKSRNAVVPIPPNINIFVGMIQGGTASPVWNHSKILVTDDGNKKSLLTGGHNFIANAWEYTNYLANDVSVKVNDNITAERASNFITKLAITNFTGSSNNQVACTINGTISTNMQQCNNVYNKNAIQSQDLPKTVLGDYILTVGKEAKTELTISNYIPMTGMLSMVDSAKSEIDIGQQTWEFDTTSDSFLQTLSGAYKEYNQRGQQVWVTPSNLRTELNIALAQALLRGVKVRILLSRNEFTDNDPRNGWGNGFDIQHIITQIQKNVDPKEWPNISKNLEIYRSFGHRQIHENLNNTGVISGANYQVRQIPYGDAIQHGKYIIVDNKYAYIGSENVYYNWHAEFGVIIRSQNWVQTVFNPYWLNMKPYVGCANQDKAPDNKNEDYCFKKD